MLGHTATPQELGKGEEEEANFEQSLFLSRHQLECSHSISARRNSETAIPEREERQPGDQ